jgi:PHD/YefM family antitoxin component YafN of YafNO toxin-antitoxin module
MITPSELRQNLYNLLDKVIQTGEPIEIKRKNKVLKIIIEPNETKLDNLKKRDVLNCSPEEIIHNNWEQEWKT